MCRCFLAGCAGDNHGEEDIRRPERAAQAGTIGADRSAAELDSGGATEVRRQGIVGAAPQATSHECLIALISEGPRHCHRLGGREAKEPSLGPVAIRRCHRLQIMFNGEIFTTLRGAQVLIENWRRHYNAVRPHSSLGYRPPAPEAILQPAFGMPAG